MRKRVCLGVVEVQGEFFGSWSPGLLTRIVREGLCVRPPARWCSGSGCSLCCCVEQELISRRRITRRSRRCSRPLWCWPSSRATQRTPCRTTSGLWRDSTTPKSAFPSGRTLSYTTLLNSFSPKIPSETSVAFSLNPTSSVLLISDPLRRCGKKIRIAIHDTSPRYYTDCAATKLIY